MAGETDESPKQDANSRTALTRREAMLQLLRVGRYAAGAAARRLAQRAKRAPGPAAAEAGSPRPSHRREPAVPAT